MRKSICIAAALACAAASVPRTPAAKPVARMAELVSIQAVGPDDPVGMTDELDLEISINAATNRPVTVFGYQAWGLHGTLAVEIRDPDGRLVETPVRFDDRVPAKILKARDYWVTLHEDDFFGWETAFAVADLFPKPGRYAWRVSFRCPASRGQAPAGLRNPLWSGDGVTRTEWQEIEVVQDAGESLRAGRRAAPRLANAV